MKGPSARSSLGVVAAALVLASGDVAHACAVCMGGADSPIAPAMNAAIFLLLATVGSVLLAFGIFIVYLVRRANAPLPAHQELAHGLYREGLQEDWK